MRGANDSSISIGGVCEEGENPPLFPQGLGISRKSTTESSQQGLISTAKLEAFKHASCFPLYALLSLRGFVRLWVRVWVRVEASEPVVEALSPPVA